MRWPPPSPAGAVRLLRTWEISLPSRFLNIQDSLPSAAPLRRRALPGGGKPAQNPGREHFAQATRNLQSLALHPPSHGETPIFSPSSSAPSAKRFEPERALTNFERILETRENPDALLASLRRSNQKRAVLLTLAGGANFCATRLSGTRITSNGFCGPPPSGGGPKKKNA